MGRTVITVLGAIVCLALVVGMAGSAAGADNHWAWTSSPPDPDWYDGNNWSLGHAPLGDEAAYVDNATTSQIVVVGGSALADNLFVGSSSSGAVAHSAGTLTVNWELSLGRLPDGNGTYELSGTGQLSARNECIGWEGIGRFVQTGGVNTVWWLRLGREPNAGGTYELSGTGELLAECESVGNGGTGWFVQTGGTNTVNGTLSVACWSEGNAGYELSGTGELSADDEYIASNGGGYLTQVGGTNTVANDLHVGCGSGSWGDYYLGPAGTLSAGNEYIGWYGGESSFWQEGGTNTVAGGLYVGCYPGSDGTYSMSGGTLSADSEHIGYRGGRGELGQDGGTNTVANVLSIACEPNSIGTYEMYSGELWAGEVNVGMAGAADPYGQEEGSGLLVLRSGATANVAGTLTIRRTGTVRLDGGTLNIPNDRLANYGRFEYYGGVFNGLYEHHYYEQYSYPEEDTFYQEADFTATGGIINYGDMWNQPWLNITAGGTGFRNYGEFELRNGTLDGNDVVNEYGASLGCRNYCTIDAPLTNYGEVRVRGVLTVTGQIVNMGCGEIDVGGRLRPEAGLVNSGLLSFWGGDQIEAAEPVANNPGGLIRMVNGGSITAPLTNYGIIEAELETQYFPPGYIVTVYLGDLAENHGLISVRGKMRLHIDSNCVNYGSIALPYSDDAIVSGGDITNAGTIRGCGQVFSRIHNAGVIRAEGLDSNDGTSALGKDVSGQVQHRLVLAAAGCTNTGRIEVSAENEIVFTHGLAVNDGVIALMGSSFDNSACGMTNNGTITGHGIFRSGELTNQHHIGVGIGDMEVMGPLVNNGTVSVEADSTAVFFSDVSGQGDFPGPGTVVFLGGCGPGESPGVTDFGGDVSFGPAASLKIELANADNSDPLDPRYDALDVAGDVNLAGTLSVDWLPVPGDPNSKFGGIYSILSYGGKRSGLFGGVDCAMAAYLDTSLFAGGIEYDDANGVVKIHLHDLLDGDADLDGEVARSDFHALQDGFGSPDPDWLTGDFNFDGGVDFLDYLAWKANVGDAVPGGGKIPEPATASLLLLGAGLAVWRKRRRPCLPEGAGRRINKAEAR